MDSDNNRDTTNQGDPELSSSTPLTNNVNPVTNNPVATTPEAPLSTPVPVSTIPAASPEPVSAPEPVASVQPASFPEQPVAAAESSPAQVSTDPITTAQPTVQVGGSGMKKGPLVALIVLAVVLVGAVVFWYFSK